MNTLRAKFTALMVGGVLLVAMFATGLSFLLLSPPHFEETENALAAHWGLLADLASGKQPSGAAGLIGLHDTAPQGRVLQPPTDGINAALEGRRAGRISVLNVDGAPWPVIVGQLPDGRWLVTAMTIQPPPRNPDWALAGWIVIMALGTTLVMIVAVRRLTEPLALLVRTVSAPLPDGRLAPLPETGSTEVKATAQAINRLSARLRQAMESRIRLVAAAGHDLRTPMTRMRLRAEFLEDETERETWIADLDELDHIADSAIRLVREEVDHAARSRVRLDKLVAEVVEELNAIGMPLELAATEPAEVMVRPLSLRRAIRNLAINAATHGKGGSIRVLCDEQEAAVIIDDSGPGIPQDLMGRVFEPFFRVDPARAVSIPGAGLGLAIAHEITIGSGGRLELTNRFGSGLTQRLSLPNV